MSRHHGHRGRSQHDAPRAAKALSPQGNPRLDTINAILKALGYRLMPKQIQPAKTDEENVPVS
ncbi:MAG: hypothetical protein R2873_22750 [Caldilineaceae bacterium]